MCPAKRGSSGFFTVKKSKNAANSRTSLLQLFVTLLAAKHCEDWVGDGSENWGESDGNVQVKASGQMQMCATVGTVALYC